MRGISFETVAEILAFRDERDWKQFHNPKDLAISISLEASELLECFQWSGPDTNVGSKKMAMKAEVADILTYCLLFCDRMGIDPEDAIKEKLAETRQKYPVDLSRGSSSKYTELKLSHEKDKSR